MGAAFDHVFSFPDGCVPWRGPAVRAALEGLAGTPPDLVLATAPPWTSLQVGARLARRFGVPLVVDFRDPWTLNAAKYHDRTLAGRRARRCEAAILAQAALVIANTEPSARALALRYPTVAARIVAISNGIDMSALARPSDESPGMAMHLQLCHFGTIYGQRTPLNLLRALHTLFLDGVITPNRQHPLVRFIGGWERTTSEAEHLAALLEQMGVITREDGLPHHACIREMRRAPALLALQPASPLQIPGKLYEYVAAGRPILLIGGEGATHALMQEFGLGRQCSDDAAAIADMLRNLLSGHQLQVPSPSVAARFDYASLTARLSVALATLCPSSPGAVSGSGRAAAGVRS